MKFQRLVNAVRGLLLALIVAWPAAAQVPPGLGEGWLGEFEHMGQSIAYARTNGVVPPWSGGQ